MDIRLNLNKTMKFSWNSLNQFINLQDIEFNEIINQLTLAGFEIDGIENKVEINDKIIDLNITANRQDSLSTIGLAREISNLIQKPCLTNDYKIKNITDESLIINEITNLTYIKITIIKNLTNQISPKWLRDYLLGFEIESNNLISDIIKYTEIKWGQRINIVDISKINHESNNNIIIKIIKKKNLQYKNTDIYEEIITYNNIPIFKIDIDNNKIIQYSADTSDIIIFSYIHNKKIQNKNTIPRKITYKPDLIYGHNEAINLINQYGQGTIHKSYNYSNNLNEIKHQVKIKKKKIQKILGPINNQSSKYIETKIIKNILSQLQLEPEYNLYTKIFSINIPEYRINDLKRDIDIIEEIGRIYGYKNFIDQLPKFKKPGFISQKTYLIKQIRKTFRDIGMHEVINSSLINNSKAQNNHKNNLNNQSILLYNPLLEDQSVLRTNLIDNLIRNKIYNNNQQNKNLEIFEIGKIFYQNLNTKIYKEEIHIAGILSNNTFIKKSWEDKYYPLNWFHAKGIIEVFFEKLQINLRWDTVNNLNISALKSHLYKYYNPRKTAIIKNQINNKIIGILGELNPQLNKTLSDGQYIYIFEINLQELIEVNKRKTHLEHTLSSYSRYPNVIRDISITIDQTIKINDIKKYILDINHHFIKNVEIFNEYYNKINNDRNVGIRITYGSSNRTLNNKDIKYIDKTIINIFNYINKLMSDKSKP